MRALPVENVIVTTVADFMHSAVRQPSCRQYPTIAGSSAIVLSKSDHSLEPLWCTDGSGGNMDHNESQRKFERLMEREADRAHETATELEALIPLLPSEKSRQLAQLQAKASHKQAKDFRELAQKVKET
jgi:hypothetical protein